MSTVDLSKLQKAKLVEVDTNGTPVSGGLTVECMFNPAEYTVSKSNQYAERPKQSGNASAAEFKSVGSQSLKLSLLFDTYESGKDVSDITRKLWDFMLPKSRERHTDEISKQEPVQDAFEWGVFRFVAYITNMTQRFTLFTHQGVPVRARVDVDFTQYTDLDDYRPLPTNPSSGGGPVEQLWRVSAGDRLDTIAAAVYQAASQWRRIAEHNHLLDPLALRPGQVLRIPLE